MIRNVLVAFFLLLAAPALAQTFPPLTGRVVDVADLLQPAQEAELTQKLHIAETADIDPADLFILEALKDVFDMVDFAFFDRMGVVIDQLDNRFVTDLLRWSDERCRCSTRLVVSYFLHKIKNRKVIRH